MGEGGNDRLYEYFPQWLEIYKKPYVKPITYTLQESNIRLNILPRWGNYRLKEITRSEYQKWINSLIDKYSEGTIRRIHSIMNSAISDAVHEFCILRENPLVKIKIPKNQNEDKELKFFTINQLEVFLEGCYTPVKNAKYQLSKQNYSIFALMSRTGLRIGETLALTWDDINFEEKIIKINKTLVYPTNTTPYLSTPKSKKSNRNVRMDQFTINLLKKHRLNQKEVCIGYLNYDQSTDNLVFHQHEGRWLRTNVVREFFKTICKRVNLPVLSPHALRHSHAVHLLESGATIKYVSERLGHASVKITADTYLHITDKIETDSLAQYEKYFSL